MPKKELVLNLDDCITIPIKGSTTKQKYVDEIMECENKNTAYKVKVGTIKNVQKFEEILKTLEDMENQYDYMIIQRFYKLRLYLDRCGVTDEDIRRVFQMMRSHEITNI